MSAAYVGQELESEFGKIPPSFLPLGNRRLFQYQITLAPKGVSVYLSLPESYSLPSIDRDWLEKHKVSIIPTPDGLTLGASLVASLNLSGNSLDKPLHVLYGDTYYQKLPIGDDIVSTSVAKDSYNWAVLTDDSVRWLKSDQELTGDSHRIIDGYFKFSNPRELIKRITQCEWDFIEGLNLYHQSLGLTSVESMGWLDFGHVNTYYRSKAKFTTQRSFNELKITPYWIEKSSLKNEKIAAEANWFAQLPFALRGHIPQYLGCIESDSKISYRLEYLHLTALNELYVFSKLPSHIWSQILISCLEFLTACYEHKAPTGYNDNSLDALFNQKTNQRLEEYCKVRHICLKQEWCFNGIQGLTIEQVLKDSIKYIPNGEEQSSILHGDFCFSNILYDFRAGKIKTIDPRGLTSHGEKSLYGDIRYDIAKLSHSILGLYDLIIAGYFQVEVKNNVICFEISEENSHKEIQHTFIQQIEERFGLTAQNLYAMQIQLFLSMLPLHGDDFKRQDALFANAFRLHQILKRLEQ